jgi:hypothetical protein
VVAFADHGRPSFSRLQPTAVPSRSRRPAKSDSECERGGEPARRRRRARRSAMAPAVTLGSVEGRGEDAERFHEALRAHRLVRPIAVGEGVERAYVAREAKEGPMSAFTPIQTSFQPARSSLSVSARMRVRRRFSRYSRIGRRPRSRSSYAASNEKRDASSPTSPSAARPVREATSEVDVDDDSAEIDEEDVDRL